jgi:anti-anti-sigma regulatory factor
VLDLDGVAYLRQTACDAVLHGSRALRDRGGLVTVHSTHPHVQRVVRRYLRDQQGVIIES